MNYKAEISSTSSLIFVIGLAILGPIVFLLLPVVLGALYNELGLGESQLGLLATVELLGIAVAATTGLYWAARWNWRTVARISIAVLVVGNIVTSAVLADASFNQLLAIRFSLGLAGGALMAIMYSYLAHRDDTERAAGFLVSAQTGIQVAGFYLLPAIIALPLLGGIFLGAKGIFAVFAVFAAVLLVASGSLPIGPSVEVEAEEQEALENEKRAPAVIVLVSFLLFFAAQSAVWGFLELFGADSGMDSADTILAIILSTGVAALSPLVAGFYGNRFGQFKPLVVAGVMQFAGLAMLLFMKTDFLSLAISLSVFQIGWVMALPYHLGVLTDVDPSHRLIVLTSPASAVGIALGPVFGGVFIELFGYSALFIASGVVLALYLACILPFAGNTASE